MQCATTKQRQDDFEQPMPIRFAHLHQKRIDALLKIYLYHLKYETCYGKSVKSGFLDSQNR